MGFYQEGTKDANLSENMVSKLRDLGALRDALIFGLFAQSFIFKR
jgi:hypothetical protein